MNFHENGVLFPEGNVVEGVLYFFSLSVLVWLSRSFGVLKKSIHNRERLGATCSFRSTHLNPPLLQGAEQRTLGHVGLLRRVKNHPVLTVGGDQHGT